jgi:hypothetical protein
MNLFSPFNTPYPGILSYARLGILSLCLTASPAASAMFPYAGSQLRATTIPTYLSY